MIESTLLAYTHFTYQNAKEADTRPNLVHLLERIVHMMKNNTDALPRFSAPVESDLAQYFSFTIASPTSFPEAGVTYRHGSLRMGVIGSEAKDLYHSAAEALPQGAGLASEMAVDQFRKGVPGEKILVPYLLSFGDSIQFGAAFIMKPSFPVPVELSEPFSLVSWEGRRQICKWIRALALYCDRQATAFSELAVPTAASLSKINQSKRIDLNVGDLFVKPVEVRDEKVAGYMVAHILAVFHLLWQHQPCRSFVVFPVGRCGMPSDPSNSFRIKLMEKIRPEHTADIHRLDGWPILLYPKLRRSKHWRNPEHYIDELCQYKDAVLKTLAKMLAEVERAGVIHLDLRMANIMVKFPSSKKRGSAVSSSSSAFVPQLKIVD